MVKKILIDLNFAGTNHLYTVNEKNDVLPAFAGTLEDVKFYTYQTLQECTNVKDIYLMGQEKYAEGFKKELLNDVIQKYFNRNVRIYINDKIFN